MGNQLSFATNNRLAVIPAAGGTPRSLTDAFDEQPGFVAWNANGLYFSGSQKTASHLFHLDPASTRITRVSTPDPLMAGSFSLTADGRRMAFTSSSPTSLNEVFVTDLAPFAPKC
jgi:dipeptidyl aminopeptidase/acylaminoacyl peptidase